MSYSMESLSPKYKQLMKRQAELAEERDKIREALDEFCANKEANKVSDLKSQVDALISGKAEKAKKAATILKEQEAELIEKEKLLALALDQIKQEIIPVRDEARQLAIKAARKDHAIAASKSMAAMRQLAEAQLRELAIIKKLQSSIGPNSGLTASWSSSVLLGCEDVYGDPMFNTVKLLRSHGYEV